MTADSHSMHTMHIAFWLWVLCFGDFHFHASNHATLPVCRNGAVTAALVACYLCLCHTQKNTVQTFSDSNSFSFEKKYKNINLSPIKMSVYCSYDQISICTHFKIWQQIIIKTFSCVRFTLRQTQRCLTIIIWTETLLSVRV